MSSALRGRIDWLKAQCASTLILTREQRMIMLSEAATNAAQGLKPYLKEVTPDGDLSFDVTAENLTNSIESIEQRIDANGAVIRKIKVREMTQYITELNKMDGAYKPQQLEVLGAGLIINMTADPEAMERARLRREQEAIDDARNNRDS